MAKLRILLVSTFVPRHDGLATFTADLERSLSSTGDALCRVVAIDPRDERVPYGGKVVGRIRQGSLDSYLSAAMQVKELRPDIVCLQHEFGLWGEWQDMLVADFILPFIDAVNSGTSGAPVVTTLHTIRPSPGELERTVLHDVVEQSAAAVVMARTGALILMDDYGTSTDSLVRIPHGVPVVERLPRRHFKRQLELQNRTVICTVGMLDRRKGIEYVIEAMKTVVETHPEAIYLIVGETHPEVRKHAGEEYRNELRELVRELGLEDNVSFVNSYLNDRELVDYLQATDIYVTPYLDRNQITSGTLSFAIGTGKAIVSTPYAHATEALAEGRGLLAEFRSAESIARCLLLLLDDPPSRFEMERRTAEYGKGDAWPRVGQRYLELFRRVAAKEPLTNLLALEPEPIHAGHH
jgi:polysaccharide biosynthesis protein PslF